MKDEYIRSLTGIRFFAALWVVLFHFKPIINNLVPVSKCVNPVLDKGHHSVPLFFILSGFILSHRYFGKYEFRNHLSFVRARFSRLWPVHFIAIGCFLLYYFISHLLQLKVSVDRHPYNVLFQETAMIRCWFTRETAWNYPAWSIQSEWFAYIFLFPVCFFLFNFVRGKLVMLSICTILLFAHGILPVESFPSRIVDIALLFMGGSALYRLKSMVDISEFAPVCVVIAMIGAAAGMAIKSPVSGSVMMLSFGLMIISLSYDKGMIARLLGSKWAVYGGTISYSLYMTHALVQQAYMAVAGRMPSGPVYGILVGAVLIASTIVCAAAFHHLVEVPGNRLLGIRRERILVPRGSSEGQS
jgi:peptidoglycan/LPS O-acetylase OafA/YrhL